MELLPELCLAPTSCRLTLECSSSSESSDTSSSRKRKALSDGFVENKKSFLAHRSIDLQHSNERLPLDWEQCLDLESGKMYFLNRKTLKRSWDRPTGKDQHHEPRQSLDLELNISSPTAAPKPKPASIMTKSSYLKKSPEVEGSAQTLLHVDRKDDDHQSPLLAYNKFSNAKEMTSNNNNNNMVAMACMNCHLLVIVSKSSPTCPNCKYVHSVPAAQQISPAPRKPTLKPLDTLSLFS